jgi:hypothetical protein
MTILAGLNTGARELDHLSAISFFYLFIDAMGTARRMVFARLVQLGPAYMEADLCTVFLLFPSSFQFTLFDCRRSLN